MVAFTYAIGFLYAMSKCRKVAKINILWSATSLFSSVAQAYFSRRVKINLCIKNDTTLFSKGGFSLFDNKH